MCRIFVPKTKTRHIFMADNTILNRLDGLKLKYEETGQKLTDPEVIADVKQFVQLTKEYKELEPIIETSERYRTAIANLAEAKDTLATDKDEEMREMAREMIAELEPQLAQMEEEIKLLLDPQGPAGLEERHRGDPRRHGRRRGGDLRRRPAAHVHQIHRVERLALRNHLLVGRRRRRLQGGGAEGHRDRTSTGRSNTSRACTACSACPRPRRRAACTPRPHRWPCCPKPRSSTSRSR